MAINGKHVTLLAKSLELNGGNHLHSLKRTGLAFRNGRLSRPTSYCPWGADLEIRAVEVKIKGGALAGELGPDTPRLQV